MPPKKVQQKPQPIKQAPKIQQKKLPQKNAKNLKQQPKKDGKGSIQKTGANNKAPQKQQTKPTDKKDDKKGTDKKQAPKQNPKDAKILEKSKDPKANEKKQVSKDVKDLKQQKKDPKDKSIAKVEPIKEQLPPKKDGKKGAKQNQSKTILPAQKQKTATKAIINNMDDGDEKPQRVKGDDYLIKETGLLQAYQQFLRTICKYGLPTGDIYQFAAQQIQKYQRKKKAKQLKLKAQMQIRKAASKRPLKSQNQSQFTAG